MQTFLHRYRLRLFASLGGFGLLGVAGWLLWYTHQPVRLEYNLGSVAIHQPIKVTFSHQVTGHLNYNLSPSLAGSWKVTHGVLGVRAITFYPAKPLEPGSNYDLTLGHIAQIGHSRPVIPQAVLKVQAQKPAAVASVSPSPAAGNVPVTTKIAITLSQANDGLRRLSLSSDAPLASSQPTTTDNRHFFWKLSAPLQQGTTYHLNLSDLNQRSSHQVFLSTSFTTVAEPQITAATAHDHFYPGSAITVTFNEAMRPVNGDFHFNMPGSGHWQSAQSYEFTPTGLAAGQTYSYTVAKNSAATNGGVVASDHTYQIATPGPVYVTGASPRGSNLAVNSPISISFDQPVDHASAQGAFSLSPGAAGSFSWSGNTMTFHPAGLGYQTGYTMSVAPGVKGTYGLPETGTFSAGFSTTYQTIKLNVPQFYQAYTESCEAASLRMALANYGVSTSDFSILQQLGYNPRSRDTGTNTWDNPYQMFVGDVNGVQDTTGYGVFAPPIASAAQSFGRGATVANGVGAGYIAQQIYNGHPVVAWGYSVHPALDSWNVPGGGAITAYKGEHARVVYGVAGSPGNVVGFYIRDPVYGSLYWTAAQLMANMNIFGATSNQTVTVE